MSAPYRDQQENGNRAIDWRPGRVWSAWDIMNRYAVGELVDLQSFFSGLATSVTNSPPQIKYELATMNYMKKQMTRYLELVDKLELPVTAKSASQVMDC